MIENFLADRTLPRDHIRIVVRVDKGQTLFCLQMQRVFQRIGKRVAMQHNFGAMGANGIDFDLGRRAGHDDDRLDAQFFGFQRHPHRVIACGSGDNPHLFFCLG